MKKTLFSLFLLGAVSLSAQIRNADVHKLPEMNQENTRELIRIPSVLGYKVLKCDFHNHTVFSDGLVWPTMRVEEAWKDGLDAISITDHIEYQPWHENVKGDHNSSYNIAKPMADRVGMILIKGAEITREKPFGHMNALFITDAIPLQTAQPIDAVNEAIKQNAFIMWNHPGWPDDKCTKFEVHDQLIKEGKIHGIEVFNWMEYYPKSFDWARDMKLAFMSNSDIHGSTHNSYGLAKLVRPMTLVFVTDSSVEGVREALFAGRSLALFNGELAGPKNLMRDLFKASLSVEVLYTDKNKISMCNVTNISDISYDVTISGARVIFPANKTVRISVGESGTITVNNCHTGSGSVMELKYPF